MRAGWSLWGGLGLVVMMTGGSFTVARGQVLCVREVIDPDFKGGYQVEVADVNGDGKPDVVALGGGTCAWYENPLWIKREITGPDRTPAIISCATADLDGDGKAEVAIAYDFEMNNPKRGKLGLAIPGSSLDARWDFRPIGDLPSVHRVRWGDFDGDGSLDLVAAPIFGPEASPPLFEGNSTVVIYNRKPGPAGTAWEVAGGPSLPVLHAIAVVDVDRDGKTDLLAASNRGVTLHRMTMRGAQSAREWRWEERLLNAGAAGTAPYRGSSEVHWGRLSDGRRFVASIQPWHGSQVAVSLESFPNKLQFEAPQVIDDALDAGHALWVADVDGDGDDEVFAGHRGKGAKVTAYDYDGIEWQRTVVDEQITAQDLRGGDLDGDGTPDVVAIGGQTHNVMWYRPVGK
jgi:hypothetical protein